MDRCESMGRRELMGRPERMGRHNPRVGVSLWAGTSRLEGMSG